MSFKRKTKNSFFFPAGCAYTIGVLPLEETKIESGANTDIVGINEDLEHDAAVSDTEHELSDKEAWADQEPILPQINLSDDYCHLEISCKSRTLLKDQSSSAGGQSLTSCNAVLTAMLQRPIHPQFKMARLFVLYKQFN